MRRAFALPVVLLLLLTVSLALTAALQRHSAQQLAIQRQVNEYRMHHEMFGARAIVLQWMERARISDLNEVADSGDVAYGFTIPGGSQIRAFLRDGQGTLCTSYASLDERALALYERILGRIGPNRSDLVRHAGPPQVSLNAAPPELVRAIFGEDLEIAAERIIDSRRRERLSRSDVTTILQRANADAELIRDMALITTTDSRIWAVDIEMDNGVVLRQFEMLVEINDGRPMMLGWRELFAGAETGGTEQASGASRRRRSR